MSPQGLAYICVIYYKAIRLYQKTLTSELTTRHVDGGR